MSLGLRGPNLLWEVHGGELIDCIGVPVLQRCILDTTPVKAHHLRHQGVQLPSVPRCSDIQTLLSFAPQLPSSSLVNRMYPLLIKHGNGKGTIYQ